MNLYGKKEKKVCAAMLAAVLLTGCNVRAEETGTEAEMGTGTETGIGWTEVTADSGLTELADGLSVVRFDGDDGFADFLENGGASSDSEVVEYLAESGFAEILGFSFPDIPFGCSAVSVTAENGERMFGRNFDWYNCDALILENHPEGAYASLSTVNTSFITDSVGTIADFFLNDTLLTRAAIYAPLDGMNEQGLAVSVNMIEDYTIEQDTEKPDITTTTAVRLLLNEAADVEEALELLRNYDLHASFGYMVHLAVSDASGRSVAVEYVDNEMVVTETPIVTNHYLAEGEKNGIGTQQSHTRFSRLVEYLQGNSITGMEDVAAALKQVSKHNFNDGETTEWSAVFNQNTGEALYFHREDYGTGYRLKLG